ncbi:hypothetical protein NFI96_023532 [Prochilodus magdalenae]|nr:hypothetical protein NFI96_023532 [Prochilodus magdalenae]
MFQTTLSTLLRKRRRPEPTPVHPQQGKTFGEVTLYLVERRMGTSRRNFLTSLARSKGFCVDNTLSARVTHIVAEGNSAQELWPWLQEQGLPHLDNTNVLDITWFTESMRAGRPVPVEAQHCIQQKPSLQLKTPLPDTSLPAVSQYACQRRTTLDNHNKLLTDALEVLAENYEFNDSKGPCLGFRRAVSVLKSLTTAMRSLQDTEGLPCLGEDSKTVIEEMKSTLMKDDEKFVANHSFINLINHLFPGFLYYEDISKPVTIAEAKAVGCIIKETSSCFSSGVTVTLTGGFRRRQVLACAANQKRKERQGLDTEDTPNPGKAVGHDVDFILTIPEPGKEDGLLPAVISRLRSQWIYSESILIKWIYSEPSLIKGSTVNTLFKWIYSEPTVIKWIYSKPPVSSGSIANHLIKWIYSEPPPDQVDLSVNHLIKWIYSEPPDRVDLHSEPPDQVDLQ